MTTDNIMYTAAIVTRTKDGEWIATFPVEDSELLTHYAKDGFTIEVKQVPIGSDGRNWGVMV